MLTSAYRRANDADEILLVQVESVISVQDKRIYRSLKERLNNASPHTMPFHKWVSPQVNNTHAKLTSPPWIRYARPSDSCVPPERLETMVFQRILSWRALTPWVCGCIGLSAKRDLARQSQKTEGRPFSLLFSKTETCEDGLIIEASARYTLQ